LRPLRPEAPERGFRFLAKARPDDGKVPRGPLRAERKGECNVVNRIRSQDDRFLLNPENPRYDTETVPDGVIGRAMGVRQTLNRPSAPAFPGTLLGAEDAAGPGLSPVAY
jgi:hypothetical protein